MAASIRLARRKYWDGGTSLMTCSWSSKVGFFRPMSMSRFLSRALLRGRTWSTKAKLNADMNTPQARTGTRIW